MAGPLAVAALCAMIVLTIHTYTGWLYALAPMSFQSTIKAYDSFMYHNFILTFGVTQTAFIMLTMSAILAMVIIWIAEKETQPKNKFY